MAHSRSFQVHDGSQAGEARRAALQIASELGLDEESRGRAAIVVTEAAGNLAKHATSGGEVILTPIERDGVAGIETVTVDAGPGMDVARCFRDGFSTAGTPGTGLGAISRMSSLFDIHSAPGKGTVMMSRVMAKAPRTSIIAPRELEVSALCVPYPGERVCGDAFAVHQRDGRTLIMIADGLGHGIGAADAANEALRIFKTNGHLDSVTILEVAHMALRSTRGAAMAIAEVLPRERLVHFAGVGNISASLVAPEVSRNLVSSNGTVGVEVRTIRSFSYPWQDGSVLVMSSDGLGTHWDLSRYPGALKRHPSVIAGLLYRDYSRRRDDVTVVVAREPLAQ